MKRASLAAEFWWVLRSHWRVMLAVLPGVALALAHSTMLNVPSADIIDALDTDRYRIHWISGSYVLGSALGMALTKFCSSRIGLRRSYLLGALVFALAGGACGLVNDVILMAPLRWFEGLGNGLMISAGMVILWNAFPRHRELAMALYGMAVFVPATAGAVIGGLITALESWRWIFFIDLPLGAIVIALAWLLLPHDAEECAPHPVKFDVVGVGLLLASIVTISVVLDLGQYWGWVTSRQFSVWLIGCVAAFSGFLAWGLWGKNSLFNLRIFGRRNITLGLLVKILFSINLYSLVAILSKYMIDLRGYQWWQAAMVILPAVATMALSIGLGIALGRDGNRRLRMFFGLGIMLLCTWQLTMLDMYTSKFWLAAVLGVWGCGAGLVIEPALSTIFAGLSMDDTMTLAGVFNICRVLPAYVAAIAFTTLWTQSTDAHFDTLRQNVRYNRPVVSASYESADQRFVDRGSPHDRSAKQSHAMISQWTHANALAFALEDVLGDLALVLAPGLILVCLVQRSGQSTPSFAKPQADATAYCPPPTAH